MKLTDEQEGIIKSQGNIKINAVAGSGKTTTVIEYARTRPPKSKILYLAFNRSVKVEAEKKFAEKKIDYVDIETAHSLAFKHIVKGHGYKIKNGSYKTYEIVDLLGLQSNGEKHTEYVLANHINKFMAYFCNSDKQKVQDLNYLDVVIDPKAIAFVTNFYNDIEKYTRVLLGKMDSREIEITHDFYLKKFQLSNPELFYDYILFDEGQDASIAMLDIFLKQNAIKVIVGDTHQQIYGWRYAVNSLERVDFKTFHLSTSFRFGQDIADLATQLLEWKNYLRNHDPVSIIGKGSSKDVKSEAVIGRTNLGLLMQAINYVVERKVKRIYFEGNINTYTYAEDGASLYDVLNLYNGKRGLIRDKMIKSMKDINELEEYIEKTEDVQLATMVDLVKDYGNTIPTLIKKIKEMHVSDNEKEKADMIFSTVHRCKGMEYDVVHLANDFLSEERLKQLKNEVKEDGAKARLIEEINLLYVAVTRSKNIIHLYNEHLPIGFPESLQIKVNQLQEIKEDRKPTTKSKKKNKVNETEEKTYTVEKARETNKNAYAPWTDILDEELTKLYCEGKSVNDIAFHFGRNKGAIYSRIAKLELEEKYG